MYVIFNVKFLPPTQFPKKPTQFPKKNDTASYYLFWFFLLPFVIFSFAFSINFGTFLRFRVGFASVLFRFLCRFFDFLSILCRFCVGFLILCRFCVGFLILCRFCVGFVSVCVGFVSVLCRFFEKLCRFLCRFFEKLCRFVSVFLKTVSVCVGFFKNWKEFFVEKKMVPHT